MELSKLEEQEQILEDSAKGYDSLSYEIRGLKSSKDGLVSKANEWLRARQKFISDTVSELKLKNQKRIKHSYYWNGTGQPHKGSTTGKS